MIDIMSYLPSVGAVAAIFFSLLSLLERHRDRSERLKEKEEAATKKLANADDVKNLAANLATNVAETKSALAADVKKLADALAEATKETKSELLLEIKELQNHAAKCDLNIAVVEERLSNQIELFNKIDDKVDTILNEVGRNR